jgi:putative cardiolipin synthase
MHNKSFTADGQATIVGGRNVGDEYFDATAGMAFVDLDVLTVGPVVRAVSDDFDRYWASASAYPLDRLLPPAGAAETARLAAAAAAIEANPAAASYLQAVRNTPFVRDLLAGRLAVAWAPVRMVSDPPAKGLGLAAPEALLPRRLHDLLGDPAEELDLVSAYFVPGGAGVEALTAMARRGVKVRILTNALEATDVAIVHAGYAKRRRALLEAGIGLYEMRRQSSRPTGSRAADLVGASGSSASSLHAKTFRVDHARVFVGSFNLDPRSAAMNTESGFVIESPALARQMATALGGAIHDRAYEVCLSERGSLSWVERRGTASVRHTTEPGTTWWTRAAVRVLSLLPIEGLL